MRCPICSNKNLYEISHNYHYVPQNKSITKIETKILYCINCDFFFNSFRDQKFFDEFYKKNPIRNVKVYKQYDLKQIIKIIKMTPYKNKSLLEIGGGDNIQTKIILKKYKTSISNFEKNPGYKTNIIENKRFDTILSFHVLEHVIDLHSHVQMMNEKLKKNGYLIIEVPDIKFYKKNIFLYNYSHVNHFSKKNLIKILSLYNFHLINKVKATRKFGMLFIFKKKSPNFKKNLLIKNIGINHIDIAERKIIDVLKRKTQENKLIIWGISEFITPILKNFSSKFLEKRVYFVDINAKKKKSLSKFNLKVYKPNEIKEKKFNEILILSPRGKVIELVKQQLTQLNIDYRNIKIDNIGTNNFW